MSSSDSKKDPEQKLEENVNELELLIKKISAKVENASVLNGGFDEIRDELKEIKWSQLKVMADLNRVHEDIPEIKKEVASIKDAIYDPDNGLYSRIKESNADSKRREDMLKDVSTRTSLIAKKLDSMEDKIGPMEETTKKLKKIAGDDLEQLKSITKTKENINKLWWAAILAISAGIGKFIWDQIAQFF